jgi:hypothetical protein
LYAYPGTFRLDSIRVYIEDALQIEALLVVIIYQTRKPQPGNLVIPVCPGRLLEKPGRLLQITILKRSDTPVCQSF